MLKKIEFQIFIRYMNLTIWALNKVHIVMNILLHVPKPMDIKEYKPHLGGMTCGRNNLD